MSSRALRRRQEQIGILDPLAFPNEDASDSDDKNNLVQHGGGKRKNKNKQTIANPFELLTEDLSNEEDGGLATESTDNTDQLAENENVLQDNAVQESKKKKKKKKKRGKENKSKSKTEEDADSTHVEDEVEASIREVNRILGETGPSQNYHVTNTEVSFDMRGLLRVEYRNLNPDNELKRIFGSRVVRSENMRPRNRNRPYQRPTKLVQCRDNWPPIGKNGLSMCLSESRSSSQYFTFEHSHQYQQIQFMFFDAVETLNPENITNLIQAHPYHIDSLMQMSEIFRMSEDMQTAAQFIERALYAFENAFHPSFSLTTGTCRLDYRRQENRAFHLCLFKHLMSVGQRGCYRTALEFCKMLLSLDPDTDPLCVLLMIDFYALRAEEFHFLIRMSNEWEAHRNLSQLPNFAFSVPLAMFHESQQNNTDCGAADEMLQRGLIMFPGFLMSVLDKCSVHPDSVVSSHAFFGPASQYSQSLALKQLIALYVGRCFPCWKEPEVIVWLERNVKVVLERVDKNDPLVEDCSEKRKVRYQGTPRNILRHIILAEVKDATAALPPELANSPVLSYDPLPPQDAIVSYTRPDRPQGSGSQSNPLSLFLRSLLPNYNPEEPGEEEGATGGDNPQNNLRRGVGALMDAMRDLLNNIQLVPPPVENQQGEGEERNDEEWE
ncbi:transcription factor 25-like [Gigantopelta aegis]|uniref:transcription factor 25-like n=1 Tax=Gigantopelta aegis TaxID=1735272 RepID=UPI001B888F01|nr:transcription factor 25-like [Gigantopelta aegis]